MASWSSDAGYGAVRSALDVGVGRTYIEGMSADSERVVQAIVQYLLDEVREWDHIDAVRDKLLDVAEYIRTTKWTGQNTESGGRDE